jgi:hypothetical protein
MKLKQNGGLLIGQCMVKTLNNAGQMKLEDSKVAI